ncbi:DNA repair protein complementing XP-C cells homolog [Anopheles funestus]|uniref:DNA repair protein complementing XP-C cells homolog n=1 Tax=Anopheles funestus TaxID=62324 RepID=UPI0020C725D0|nr:DNA repair protein complementing XP-C cells homolog [Anopheles funestus]
MSDEEDVLTGSEEDADFSASEDEWLPTKKKAGKNVKAGNSSNEDDDDGSTSLEDSDLEDFDQKSAKNKRKRSAGKSTAPKQAQLADNKRKRLTPGLRDRLYQQYKNDLLKEIAPAKHPLNSSVSDILQKCQYQRKSNKSVVSQSAADDSDSSGDDHLVDPEKLDLGATFFNKDEPTKPSGSKDVPPQFDVNAGMRLSDSSEGEENQIIGEESLPASIPKRAADKLISHINQQSSEFMNFTNLDQFTAKVEEAKKLLKSYQQRENVGKESTVDISNNEQTTVQQENVSNLLAMGEKDAESTGAKQKVSGPALAGDSTDSEWEEVQTGDNVVEKKEDTKPPTESTGGWQVTIEMETAQSKRKRREEIEMELYIKREINRAKRKNQLNYHKSSVLGAICIGQRLNSIVNGSQLRGLLMSIMQTKCTESKVKWDDKKMKSLATWYKEQFVLLSNDFLAPRNGCNLSFILSLAVYTRKVACRQDYILLFLACLRMAGVQARLVLSANVPPKRPAMSDLCPMSERQIKEKFEKCHSNGKAAPTPKDTPEKAPADTVEKQNLVSSEANEPKLEIPAILTENEEKNEKSPLSIATKENPAPTGRSRRHDNTQKQTQKPVEQTRMSTRRKALSTLNIPQLDGGDDRIVTSENKLPETRSLRSRSVTTGQSQSPGSAPFAKRKSNTQNTIESKPQTITTRKRKLFAVQPEVTPEPVTTTRTSARKAGKQAPIQKEEKEPKVKRRTIRSDPPSEDDDDFEMKNKSKAKKTVKEPKKIAPEKDDKLKVNTMNNPQLVLSDIAKSPEGKQLLARSSPKAENPQIVLSDIAKSPEGKQLLAGSSPKAESTGSGIKAKKTVTKQPRRAAAKKKNNSYVSDDSAEDSDFEMAKESSKVRKKRSTSSATTKTAKKSPRASHQTSASEPNNQRKTDLWIEFYCEKLKRWITFDLATEQIDCLDLIMRNATSPISYVFAWDNEGHLKDVTARYVKNWNTACRMLRVEQAWLDDVLRPFAYEKSESDLLEEKELNKLDADKPLPKTISELKNHPLYALRRHLLKFEALYPAEPPTLGFIRGEAIYPRECVHTLQTREKWYKQGRVVRAFETAYKVVKCWRYDRPTNTWLGNQPCDIFGFWQTDEFDPPTAENGLVPRNEYGNVELFTEKMLPKGTVHLKLPGLNKVCKRLQIDCAPALTGFDMAKMRMVPVYDGFVVCKEYAEQAVEEWYKEMEKEEIREQEKFEKRVYGNWKRLIKGLLVRRKLQNKYNFDSLAL